MTTVEEVTGAHGALGGTQHVHRDAFACCGSRYPRRSSTY